MQTSLAVPSVSGLEWKSGAWMTVYSGTKSRSAASGG
jgi:hypothetical protein